MSHTQLETIIMELSQRVQQLEEAARSNQQHHLTTQLREVVNEMRRQNNEWEQRTHPAPRMRLLKCNA